MRWRRSLCVCAALLGVVGLVAPSSSAADPVVVAGEAGTTCPTPPDRAQLAGDVAPDEASFDGSSPLLTLASADSGGLYVGDTVAIRKVAEEVSTVAGRAPATRPLLSTPSDGIEGRPPTDADLTVAGVDVSGNELYFVHLGGTDADPTMQVFSFDLTDPAPRLRARSLVMDAGHRGPHGLAVDGGVVYLTDSDGSGGRLGRLRPDQSIDWYGVPHPVESVAVDGAARRAYVAGAGERVEEVDLTTTPPRVTQIGPRLSPAPAKRVALDKLGGVLFVADPGTGSIEEIGLTGGQAGAQPSSEVADESTLPAISAVGLAVGRQAPGTERRLFVLDSATCAVLALESVAPGTAPASTPGSTAPSAPAGEDRETSHLTIPGERATDPEAASGGAERFPAERPVPNLEDTGGRLTADDLVNQLLAGRSDGAFGGSRAITDEELALLSTAGSRGESLVTADAGGIALDQAAAATPPTPPPPVVPSPGPEAILSSAAGAPPPAVPAAPPQPAGAPPPAPGQVNPTPGWAGASSDAAEGAPRYAMVSRDDEGAGAAVLAGLLVLGGCSLAVAFGAASGGRPRAAEAAAGDGRCGQRPVPAPARGGTR